MKRILSIFLIMVFVISLSGFVSAESNQPTKVIAQTEAPAPTPTPKPKKHKHHHAPTPAPSPMAPQ